jgi:hypothetical protein
MGTSVVLADGVRAGVGVERNDAEGPGAVGRTVRVGTLWAGEVPGVGVEVEALPHPAASIATSVSAAALGETTIGEVRSHTLLRPGAEVLHQPVRRGVGAHERLATDS